MKPRLRRAVETVVAQRGLYLDPADIEALVEATAEAVGRTAWVDDQEAMHLTGHSTAGSFRKWCSRWNVDRVRLISRQDLERALGEMRGRGYHREQRLVDSTAKT